MDDLVPPDYARCQCESKQPLDAVHVMFRLGPPPRWERCTNKPVFLAVETKPGLDGQSGSMTLCLGCTEQMLVDADLRARVQLQPII